MPALPTAQSWRLGLAGALVLFLLTRVVMLTAFPIFNDEAIYLQYAQRIHADWAQNKFVSLDNHYGDWKPPLQYWMAAPVIRWANDPLLAGRSVALLVSLAGFFGFYLFTKELFGPREGVLAAALYVFCPTVLFHNDEFIAETFLFSTAPFVYWCFLKAMRLGKSWWAWLLGAAALATALLLFKQSGFLLLAVAIFLPCARFQRDRVKGTCLNFVLVVAVIIGAKFAADAFLPATFNATRDRFNSQWVMGANELLAFPTKVWAANLHLAGDYIGAYYSWLVPVFVGVFLWLVWRRKSPPELTLPVMCLTGAVAVIFLLHGFNEYIFNTAIIVALLPLLARMGILLWDLPRRRPIRVLRGGLLGGAGILLAFWSYQIVLMEVSPAGYIERSTPWAIKNYLHGWPAGFGVKEVVAMLEQEKRPGIIFADAQWGNPRTALEVYKERFPNLKLIPISRAFLDRAETRALSDKARASVPARFAIFSADPAGQRRLWEINVEAEMCAQRWEVRGTPEQVPIVVCRF